MSISSLRKLNTEMLKTWRNQFGGKILERHLERYRKSPHWIKGRFRNLERTDSLSFSQVPEIIYKQITNGNVKEPLSPLPIASFDEEKFLERDTRMKFIWYGHSALLLRWMNLTILIDPMLGPDTTPIAPTKGKRFSDNTLEFIDEFPSIDIALITHDHYDHLDFHSIEKLRSKVGKWVVALGVGRHLEYWGVPTREIVEMDWWDTIKQGDLTITFTPTRHFSGRSLGDRDKSLWGGWVIQSAVEKLWFSGDGGYGNHFKEIGKRLGPFDLAFMECGQYGKDWHMYHLFPDESITAAMDAGAMKVVPVHWGGFALSYDHNWWDPVEGFIEAAIKNRMNVLLPEMGKIYQVDSSETYHWWEKYLKEKSPAAITVE